MRYMMLRAKQGFLGLLICSMFLSLQGCKSSDNDNDEVSIPEKRATNWYIRPIVRISDSKIETVSTKLGEVEQKASSKTLRAMKPYASRYVDVVFVNPQEIPKGVYSTLFYTTTPKKVAKKWRFEVKVGMVDSKSDMSLRIRGVYVLTPTLDNDTSTLHYSEVLSRTNPILNSMYLKDTTNGVCVPVLKEDHILYYEFNMEGKTSRVFEWLLDSNITQSCKTVLPAMSYKKSSFNTKNIEMNQQFELSKPPEAKLYK